jgi:putative restriction endonuclease
MDGPLQRRANARPALRSVLNELTEEPLSALLSAAIPAVGWIRLSDLWALDRALLSAWQLSRALPNQLELRYIDQLASLRVAERDATVRQLIGQALFRDGWLSLWQGRCAISGLAVPKLLRASHAKPWAASTDAERLDVYNGLLLAAHLDAAFDCGLITVDSDGTVLTSANLSVEAVRMLGVDRPAQVKVSARHGPYLAWHRQNVFEQ